jgi:hypothetical protein
VREQKEIEGEREREEGRRRERTKEWVDSMVVGVRAKRRLIRAKEWCATTIRGICIYRYLYIRTRFVTSMAVYCHTTCARRPCSSRPIHTPSFIFFVFTHTVYILLGSIPASE